MTVSKGLKKRNAGRQRKRRRARREENDEENGISGLYYKQV
jgi:hypothetical protein